MRGIPILVLIGEGDSHTGTDRVRGISTPLLIREGDSHTGTDRGIPHIGTDRGGGFPYWYWLGKGITSIVWDTAVSTKQTRPVFRRTLYNLYKAGLTIEYCVSEEFFSRQLFGGKPSHSAHLYWRPVWERQV